MSTVRYAILLFSTIVTLAYMIPPSAQTQPDPIRTAKPTVAYKILTGKEMAELESTQRFAGSAQDRSDGYIHLSTAEQLTATVDRHFAGQTSLFIVAVDLKAGGDALKWEWSERRRQDFPHLYAPLKWDMVIASGALTRDAAGTAQPLLAKP